MAFLLPPGLPAPLVFASKINNGAEVAQRKRSAAHDKRGKPGLTPARA
jgi:hypothetical protein